MNALCDPLARPLSLLLSGTLGQSTINNICNVNNDKPDKASDGSRNWKFMADGFDELPNQKAVQAPCISFYGTPSQR